MKLANISYTRFGKHLWKYGHRTIYILGKKPNTVNYLNYTEKFPSVIYSIWVRQLMTIILVKQKKKLGISIIEQILLLIIKNKWYFWTYFWYKFGGKSVKAGKWTSKKIGDIYIYVYMNTLYIILYLYSFLLW